MEAFGIEPEELAGALQRRFQSSASVTKLPGKTETGHSSVSPVLCNRLTANLTSPQCAIAWMRQCIMASCP